MKKFENLAEQVKNYKFYLMVVTLVSCVSIIGLLLYLHSYKGKVSFGKFSLLDPARVFLDQDDYLLNIQDLRDYLSALGEKYPENISIYYEQINSGSNISVNKDLHLFPASLSKLAQAIIIARKVEEGLMDWNEKLLTRPEDLSADSGDLYKTIGNTNLSVERLMEELLVHSDNTAQNIFRRHLTLEDYIKFQDETGLLDLYNDKGLVSAKEYTRMLRVLYTSSFLDPENSEKILEYMSRATFHDYLSQGLPGGVKFAHKYGENREQFIFADSGIVYVPNRPYMITVIIKAKDFSQESRDWAVGLMKDISERAYKTSTQK